MFMHSLFSIYVFQFILATESFSTKQSVCHDDELSALFNFKQSISINESVSVSDDPHAYPKVASWKLNGSESSSDCCLWDGVECSEDTGHVIALDLRSSFLYGPINSSSSLFSLVHLKRINLADNHFMHSQIPSGIDRLSQLTSLNLSRSEFSGQIPREISQLKQLASLDLSQNPLELQSPSFRNLVQNLTGLNELFLSGVNISSELPDILANLSSLRSICLRNCGLKGKFPTGIFHLPKLQFLSVQFNHNLTGYLPEFNQSIPLKYLRLDGTSFSGKVPTSIGNLESLVHLDLKNCSFSGSIPGSLNNLTQLTALGLGFNGFKGDIPSLASLSHLTYLSISCNKFNRSNLPDWLGKLTKLTSLYLHDINLDGEIPSSLANLTQLSEIDLNTNHIAGEIPSLLMNLTRLTYLDFLSNQLQGPIPSSFSNLKNLEFISLARNNLSGTVEADIFLNLKNLYALQLGRNRISFLVTNNYTNTTLPKFKILGLDWCNLSAFPDFLRFQDELEVLYLGHNKIAGQIPEWLWNSSKETLEAERLSQNFLTGFDQHPPVLPWVNLRILELGDNMLQGPLPIPPPSIIEYQVSNNRLIGEIPPLMCELQSLQTLDLSNNNMTGTIPPCLGNLSNSLSVLNLKGNNYRGTIPDTHPKGSKLKMINLSENQLEGQVPRSLENCTMLQFLDLGGNFVDDMFPFWLGALSELQVLILRSNKFHGAIKSPTTVDSEFPKLRIIDLSDNGFTGDLPREYFHSWMAMKIIDADAGALQSDFDVYEQTSSLDVKYLYSMTITNKGVKREYVKILNIFTAIDLSSNKFRGDIPETIGSLMGLQSLNLSNNELGGGIPSSIGNLTELESLDLSQNKLVGEIPQELAQLTFLAFLNVSHNHLAGPIPQGRQFDTFLNNSYDGNSALCGDPLSVRCGNSKPSTPPLTSITEGGADSEFPSGVDWIVIFLGVGSGLVVGLIIGHNLTTRNHEWFLEKFGKRQEKGERQKRRGRRN